MDSDEIGYLLVGLLIGMVITIVLCLSLAPNGDADIGLSQEAGDLVCQKLTNNTNAIAVDWRNRNGEPRDSLICEIEHTRIDVGLIQIKGN